MAIGTDIPLYNYNDTENISNPLSDAIKSGFQAYRNVAADRQNKADLQSKLFANQIAEAKARYAQPMAQAELQEAQSKPELTRAQAVYQTALAKGVPSEIAQRFAQAALDRANTTKQNTLNENLPQRESAEISELNARAKYYGQGGSARGSTGSRDQQLFENSVANDNPHITDPSQLKEAANVLASGGNILSDGTKLNAMSPLTRMAYDRAIKATSTAALVNKGVQANQAEAEVPVLDKYITEGRSSYGDTFLGYSPQQIKDTLNSKDSKAQMRLGKYIASDLLGLDKAALLTRINGLEPGVTIINEALQKGQQTINAKYPMLSNQARQVALDTVSKAINEALGARNKYGIGASGATGKSKEMPLDTSRSYTEKEKEGRTPAPDTVWMKSKKTGKYWQIHTSRLNDADVTNNLEEVG